MARYTIKNIYKCAAGEFEVMGDAMRATAKMCLEDLRKAGVIFTDGNDEITEFTADASIRGVLFPNQKAFEAFKQIVYPTDKTLTEDEVDVDTLLSALDEYFAGEDYIPLILWNDSFDDYTRVYFYYDSEHGKWRNFANDFDSLTIIDLWIRTMMNRKS